MGANGNYRPLKVRLWRRSLLRSDGCIQWSGNTDGSGYGTIRGERGGPMLRAHRVAYELAYGTIPEGLQIDHLCRNRWCVAPNHLEPVTQQENVSRGNSGLFNRSKTHCSRGHEFRPGSYYIHRANNGRQCKACTAINTRERRRRLRGGG